ncbi:unnamed protein product [Linum tenue]|uniref:DUF3511 domain protein n=2 Tax=Linum tenue TaxID=586396 RepID=A0AAV0HS71_9ROSI|nr:unnamed protein product [Linum tenue]CAI0387904.1 unnamed protein product [Linum tenue]
MEDYRSKSYADGRSSQLDLYHHGPPPPAAAGGGGGAGMQDLRCYSASYAASSVYPAQAGGQFETNRDNPKLKKGKSANGSVSKTWSFNDPELQRKKRVASYKVYTVEGKVKGSFKKSFRWLKDRYTRVVHGWW